MAGNTVEYIKIDGQGYAVFDGGIRHDDATYSPSLRQYVTPNFEDVTPTDKHVQSDWSGGGGFFRISGEDNNPVHSYTSNVTTCFPKRFFLSPKQNASSLTSGSALGVQITHMIAYKGNVFAFGGTKGFYWDVATYTSPSANSGNIWATTGPSGAATFPGTVTDVTVYNGYLIVSCGTGAFTVYTTDSTPTLAGDWTTLAGTNDKIEYLTVLNNVLYGARSATGAYTTAAVYSTTDITAGFATLAGTVNDTTADVTGLVAYNNNLVVMKADGIYLFDTIGASFSGVAGLENFINNNNGKYAVEHYGSLFLKVRESLAEWTGNSLLGLSATRGISFAGNDIQLENDTPHRGSPQAILSVPPFLYVTVYTGSKYVVKVYDAKFGNPELGFTDWIDMSTNASSVLYYWPTTSTNPAMFIGKGTGLVYVKMPRYTFLPTEDTSCEYASTGDFYSSRILIGGLQYQKAVVDIIVWSKIDSAGGADANTITITTATDGSTSYSDPTGTGGNVISASGFTRISAAVGASTITGREFQIKATLTSADGTSTPIIYMILLRVRIQYPYQRQWLITIPATQPMDSRIKKTPKKIETDLRTARKKKNSIQFVDHFNETHTVDFIRLARQGAGKKGTGDLTNTQGNQFFEVQLVEWQDQEVE